MSRNSLNEHSYSGATSGVWFSRLGTPLPTTPTAPWGAGWNELGFITDKGVLETATRQKTKTWHWQGGSAGRSLYTQPEHSFAIECSEENPYVMRLARPGSAVVTTGGTAEQQTITFTGTGTAGTWTDYLPNYGTATGLTYNITPSALATALSAAWGITVSVTGTAGSSYVVTFPTNMGNVAAQQPNTTGITGVTANNVVETVPGVAPINTTDIVAFTGTEYWQFGIDLVDGSVHKRLIVPQGDATLTGTISYTAPALTAYAFTIDTYPDTNNMLVREINDNGVVAYVSI